MSTKFDTSRVQPQTTEPQLTSFTGVGEADSSFPGGSKDECIRILRSLNQETARYCSIASALGTSIDSDKLRRRMKTTRRRVWDYAKDAKFKLMLLLRRKKVKMESCEDLERMYRLFSACLEFLEQQYYTTWLIQATFNLHSESIILVNTGVSESSFPKKGPDKHHLRSERSHGSDIQSIRSVCSADPKLSENDELQREISDIHELVYSINQRIAIQTWEVDPDLETDKFTVGIISEQGDSRRSSVVRDSISEDNDHKRLRCVSIIILIVIIVIVGGIVGILMGVLD